MENRSSVHASVKEDTLAMCPGSPNNRIVISKHELMQNQPRRSSPIARIARYYLHVTELASL